MKYGVFSDVHANYAALRAVLARFKEEGAQGHVFCGDLIGYGPDPQGCVETIKRLPNLSIVMGNHDKALVDPLLLNFFTPDSLMPILLANKEMSRTNFDYITTLPESLQTEDFAMVHGTFRDPFKEYMLTPAQFKSSLPFWQGKVCFVGHSHIPFIMHSKDGEKVSIDIFPKKDVTIKLSPNRRYIINPGSAGQPRDENPKACAGIFDSEDFSFKLFRVPYDIKVTQTRMKEKGFPPRLIDRLALGL